MVTTRLDPRCDGLHQQAIGTPDVEEAAVMIDGLDNHLAPPLPVRRIAVETGLPLGIVRREVGSLQEVSDPLVPLVLSQVPGRQGSVNPGYIHRRVALYLADREIAQSLCISPSTASEYVHNIPPIMGS